MGEAFWKKYGFFARLFCVSIEMILNILYTYLFGMPIYLCVFCCFWSLGLHLHSVCSNNNTLHLFDFSFFFGIVINRYTILIQPLTKVFLLLVLKMCIRIGLLLRCRDLFGTCTIHIHDECARFLNCIDFLFSIDANTSLHKTLRIKRNASVGMGICK